MVKKYRTSLLFCLTITIVFKDNCKNSWTKNRFLDGLFGIIEIANKGMYFIAGPDRNDDAHHFVLWTKELFSDNIKIRSNSIRNETMVLR